MSEMNVPSEEMEGSIVRLIEEGAFHHKASMVDSADDGLPVCEFGKATNEEISSALDSLVAKAKANGFTKSKELGDLFSELRDCFRYRFGPGDLSNIEPMKIELEAVALPVKCKVKNYSGKQRRVLKQFFESAVEMRIFRNPPNACWASPPLLEPKPLTKEGRAPTNNIFEYFNNSFLCTINSK